MPALTFDPTNPHEARAIVLMLCALHDLEIPCTKPSASNASPTSQPFTNSKQPPTQRSPKNPAAPSTSLPSAASTETKSAITASAADDSTRRSDALTEPSAVDPEPAALPPEPSASPAPAVVVDSGGAVAGDALSDAVTAALAAPPIRRQPRPPKSSAMPSTPAQAPPTQLFADAAELAW